MKTILALVIIGIGLPGNAGVLGGPVTNPANGHIYYLLSQNTWSNAEAEAVTLGGHLTTVRNQAVDWVKRPGQKISLRVEQRRVGFLHRLG